VKCRGKNFVFCLIDQNIDVGLKVKPISAGFTHIGVMKVMSLRFERINGSVNGVVVKSIGFEYHQFYVLNGQSFLGHIAPESTQHYCRSHALGDRILPILLLVVVYFECIGVIPRHIG
jgi:hypothetical protein